MSFMNESYNEANCKGHVVLWWDDDVKSLQCDENFDTFQIGVIRRMEKAKKNIIWQQKDEKKLKWKTYRIRNLHKETFIFIELLPIQHLCKVRSWKN